MKRLVLIVVVSLFAAVLHSSVVGATTSLQVAPLEYRTKLGEGERKKGYVDVSNPSFERLVVSTDVQAFRQTDNKGTLKFSDSEQIDAGVLLDLDEFELGPREAVRMYFEIDGSKLPAGDVYAALFMTGKSARAQAGVVPSVRVGTLLSVVNGTPGERKAEVTRVSASLFQIGNVSATYAVRNTGDAERASGFYPEVNARLAPFGQSKEQISSLVFAGNERENELRLSGGLGGFYQLRVSYEDSYKDTYLFVLTPLSGAVIGIGLAASIGGFFYLRYRRRHTHQSRVVHKR